MNSKRVMLTLGLAIMLMTAAPVLAVDEHGEAKVSPFAGNLGNAIWTLVIFLLVVFVLGKFAWGPMLTALQNREKYIHDSLLSAKRDREEAEARLREHEERLRKSHEEAAAILEQTRREAENVRRRIEDEAKTSAHETIERARREINVARDSALRELYDSSANLATSIAGNILKRQLSQEDHQRLVQEAMGQLQERDGLKDMN